MRAQPWEPSQFLLKRSDFVKRAGKARNVIRADPIHRVVCTTADLSDGEVGEVRPLMVEQRSNQD
jgi:hypothetical protein